MNKDAVRHLAKAKGYLAKGEGFYRKCGEEIVAAQKADHTLSQREIGEWFGTGASWVGKIVQWVTTDDVRPPTPFSGGSQMRMPQVAKMLRDAPLEQVEQIISELPAGRQQAIAAAAGDRYAVARQDYDEREKNLTPADRQEREDAKREVGRFTDSVVNTFSPLTIIGHLDQASEDFSAATQRGGLTYEQMHQIEEALNRFIGLFQFARELAGEGGRDE